MKQAIHIFKKDARYLRKEIGLLAGLAVVYSWAATHAMNPVWAEMVLVIGAVYLIARLIHAESIPGDRQFWITRPYRWSSLLTAKILGLIVFVNLPILAARFYVISAVGFPIRTTLGPLLWSQFIIFLGATVPIAALAAVTSGIVPFTFAMLTVVAVGFAFDEGLAPPAAPGVRLVLTGMQWMWDSFALITLISLALAVLYLQYRNRSTLLSRWLGVCLLIAGATGYAYVPWPVAAAIQTGVSKGVEPRSLELGFAPEAKELFDRGMMWRGGVQVDVPISVRGIAPDVEVIPDAATLTFEGEDGTSWTSGGYQKFALSKRAPGRGPTTVNANVDVPLSFFEKVKEQRVRVKVALYLSIFGNARSRTISVGHAPVEALDGLQCSAAEFEKLSCRSVFRWPAALVYAQFTSAGMIPFTRSISYSPFPAGLDLLTVQYQQVNLPRDAREVTIIMEERLATVRRDLEIADFPLTQFSQPTPFANMPRS